MPKIHEVLAAERDRSNASNIIIDEAGITFSKKSDHFTSSTKSLTMFDELRKNENASETSQMQTTVHDKLNHVWGVTDRAIEATLTKEMSNASGKAIADVTVNGIVILDAMPVTALMALQKYLTRLGDMYRKIPTLHPNVEWVQAPDLGANVFQSKGTVETLKTEKALKFIELSPATKEHKAQIEKWSADVPIGKYELKHFSGMISVAMKAKYLENIELLSIAVKEAIQRGNSEEVTRFDQVAAIRSFIES